VTAKARVLALPLLALGLVAVIVAAFYIRVSCTVDGRESPGDKHEWSILQSLEATHRDSAISDLEFSERDGYHILCVPRAGSGKRVWIMLDPRNPPFYKQLPHDGYSLSPQQYEQITATRHATSTVEESLSSHVR
jgi:hypothetical protein